MEDSYKTRTAKRNGSASALTVFILFLVLLNTLGLGYLVYSVYQTSQSSDGLKEQMTALEKRIDQLNTQPSNSTNPSDSISSNTIPDSSTEASQEHTENSDASPSEAAVDRPADQQEAETATTYTVQVGDTLSGIAEEHGLSLDELMTKNNLTGTTLTVGAVLTLK